MKIQALEINENTRSISDKVLLDQTHLLNKHELLTTAILLKHIREIEVRRLFADFKCSSMHEYCVEHLKFSNSKAGRYIAAARLLTEVPEIEPAVQSGSLNLTNLAMAQSFFREEKANQKTYSKEEKKELLTSLENKSTRVVEKELQQKSSSASLSLSDSAESSPEFAKFEALLDSSSQELLAEFRNLYGNQLMDLSDCTVLKFLLGKAVDHKKKELGLIPKKNPSSNNGKNEPVDPSKQQKEQSVEVHSTDLSSALSEQKIGHSEAQNNPNLSTNEQGLSKKPTSTTQSLSAPGITRTQLRKPLPMATKRQLWKRAEGCCEFRHNGGGHRCRSKFALQPDHIVPLALGGTNDLPNLQLLCRVHNSRRAVKTFGVYRS